MPNFESSGSIGVNEICELSTEETGKPSPNPNKFENGGRREEGINLWIYQS
jgi:hypothetical protein